MFHSTQTACLVKNQSVLYESAIDKQAYWCEAQAQ